MAQPLISIRDAQTRVRDAARQLDVEPVSIAEALDRTLAEDITAAGNVPPFACSAMDGYALLAGPADRRLRIVAESRAGAPIDHHVIDGEAVRISTGAAVPPGATAVIRQEDTVLDGNTVTITTEVPPGQNIRAAGEDMRAGAAVLSAGTRLGAAELGAAVAAGEGRLTVTRRPRVAVLPTGDELRPAGEPLAPGQIHNSNGPMLSALAAHAGGAPEPPQQLADDADATEAGLAHALERADVVLVSGGVSVGPHDHVKPALHRLGVTEIFWGVALQPGKPTWFGVKDGTLVFGLPGNPVSAVVTFSLFVAPALAALLGARARGATGDHGDPDRGCQAESPPRAGCPRPPGPRRRRHHGHAYRAPGLAYRHLAARRRRARPDPAQRGTVASRLAGRTRLPRAVKHSRGLGDAESGKTRQNHAVSAFVALIGAVSAFFAARLARRAQRRRLPGRLVILSPRQSTIIAKDRGVRSVQTAELTVATSDLERLWHPENLENLARTYWRFLSRVTLGFARVIYGSTSAASSR